MKKLLLTTLLFSSLAEAAVAADFKATSPSFIQNETLPITHVFKGFGCEGENISPEISWTGAPEGTKSYAITVYDPDAPTGSGWWHWTAFNIPANINKVDAGKLPEGVKQGRTDYGVAGFGGACPPVGDKPHKYILKVWALKTEKIDADENSSGALVGYMLNANKLGVAEITAYYGR